MASHRARHSQKSIDLRFDEATSALDVIDERIVLTNIFEMSASRTRS